MSRSTLTVNLHACDFVAGSTRWYIGYVSGCMFNKMIKTRNEMEILGIYARNARLFWIPRWWVCNAPEIYSLYDLNFNVIIGKNKEIKEIFKTKWYEMKSSVYDPTIKTICINLKIMNLRSWNRVDKMFYCIIYLNIEMIHSSSFQSIIFLF